MQTKKLKNNLDGLNIRYLN